MTEAICAVSSEPTTIAPDDGNVILVVDDTPANRYVVRRILEGAGYRVKEAGSGAEGLLAAANQRPDLITLDVSLPDMLGFEVAARLRVEPDTASIPILHISASFTSSGAQARGLAGGADGYLTSPVDPQLLLATVKALLRARRAEQQQRRLAEQLAAAGELRDRLLAMVSHDLKTPLTAVRMGADALLRRGQLGAADERATRRIVGSAERMDRLIVHTLDYASALQGNELPVAPRPCDLVDVCRLAVDELRSAHPERVIELATDGGCDGNWDPERLAEVVSNLVGNAVKYGEGRVAVHVEAAPGEATLTIHNWGPPIPGDLLPHIFEAFRRGQRKGDGSRSVGLGLFIVHELVRAHGGSVSVQSSRAEGTTFTVKLPRPESRANDVVRSER